MSLLKVLNLRPRPHRAATHAPAPHAPHAAAKPAKPTPTPPAPATPQPAAAPAAAEKRYDLKFGRHDLKGATLIDTMRALAAEYQQMRGNCSAEMQAHGERMGRGAESMGAAAVAMISEGLGRAKMPPLEIWDPAFAALDRSRQGMRALSVEAALQALIEAQEAYRSAHAAVLAYDGKLEKGGERAVTTLKVTAAAGAVAAGVATGGAATAAGLGVAGTVGVGAASAGAYGATQELAGQGSEVYLANTRKAIDWKAVLRRGATDAATGLVAGFVGGALTKQFSKMFGSYLGKALTDAELVELGKALGMAGPLERTFFMTAGQKFIAEFLSGAALVPVQSAIKIAIDRISGGEPGPKNMEEFMGNVAHDVVQGGIFQLLVTFLTHKMPPKVSTGGKPPPTPEAAPGKPLAPPGKPQAAPGKPQAAPGKPTHIEPAASGAAPAKAPKRGAANDNVEVPRGGPRPKEKIPASLDIGKAANDNKETPTTRPPARQQIPKELEVPRAANDNVEVVPLAKAAGAEGHAVSASRGGGRGRGRGEVTARPKSGPTPPEGYGDVLEHDGMSTRDSPGGRKPSNKTTAGNFTHKWAEIIDDMLRKKTAHLEDIVPKGSLKPGLEAEVEVPHPDYPRKPRIDRLDRAAGEIIEIGPDTQAAQKQAEAQQYAQWMDRFEPLPGGRKWKPRTVLYNQRSVLAFLKSIGYIE